MNRVDYRLDFLTIQTDVVRQFENANQIDFFNRGNTTVTINASKEIPPQSGFSMQAFPGEVDQTIYNITFPTDDPDNSLEVTIKQYI